jgi:TRAP-type C4-dicarboxylate transport system substrate-binding protein
MELIARRGGKARALAGVLVLVGFWAAAPAGAQVIKVASLVPDGSVWDLVLEEQVEAWERDSEGRLDVRLYPGGVAGDDPAVVRKMRIGQFQAAALTFQGLMEIDEGFRVFSLPVFYESTEEVLYVLEQLEPLLKQRLEEKGFVLVNWGYAGWARFYSKRPIRVPDDLRSQKIFLWGGEETTMRIYRANGLQPVGVSSTDVTLALQTGMIECLATPPLVALTLQWFRQIPYQLDEPLAPLVGATVMTQRAWDGISAADRQAMLRASAVAESRYLEEVPGQETRAIAEMEARGLVRTTMAPGSEDGWDALAQGLAREYRGTMVPAEIYDAAVRARDEFRAGGTTP